MKKKKWSELKNIELIEYIYINSEQFSNKFSEDINQEFEELANFLSVNNEHVYSKNGILCQIFKIIPIICFPIGIDNYCTFMKDPKLKFKDEIRKIVNKIISNNKLSIEKKIPFDVKLSLSENIKERMKEGDLMIECLVVFFKMGFIKLNNQDNFEVINMKKKIIVEKDNNKIDISSIFDHFSKNKNIFLINDGTGSGKTFNSVNQYVSRINSRMDHLHTLIFTAPQKTQLEIDEKTRHKIKDNDILLLMNKSVDDFSELSSPDYTRNDKSTIGQTWESIFDKKNNDMITKIDREMKKFFNKRIQGDKNLDSKEEGKTDDNFNIYDENEEVIILENDYAIHSITELKNIFKSLRDYHKNYYEYKKYKDEKEQKEYRKRKNIFYAYAKFMALKLSIFCIESKFLGFSFEDYFKNKSNCLEGKNDNQIKKIEKIVDFIISILGMIIPFEVSKYRNCIILMTVDKTCFNAHFVDENNKGKYVSVSSDIYTMTSGVPIRHDISSIVGKDFSKKEIGGFLKDDFLKQEDNYFIKNNIGFSLIIDEEHISYNKILEKASSSTIVNEKNNIIHSLAGLYRWRLYSQNEQTKDKLKVVKEKYVNVFYKLLLEKEIFNDIKEIDVFLENISVNEYSFRCFKYDQELINLICSNVVTFSPKILNNIEILKNIKLANIKNNIVMPIEFDKKESNETIDINLFKFIQITLCFLYSLKDITKKEYKSLRKFNSRHSDADTQYTPLYNMILKSQWNKDFLSFIFDTVDDLDDEKIIDIIFSYFLPKLNFRISEMESGDIEDKDYFYFCLNINMIKHLPEVDLLRFLKNKYNKVFLLSATRGFKSLHSGNYSDNFFETINRDYIKDYFKIARREDLKKNNMLDFNKERFAKRKSVSFIDLSYNSSSKLFEQELYTVKKIDTISHNNVEKTTGTISLSEELIKLNNLFKSTLNKMQAYISINNYYHRKEIDLICDAILSSINKNESSMILSLTNNFSKIITSGLFNDIESKDSTLQFNKEDNAKLVIDINPFSITNPKKYRIVFFNSELGKNEDLASLINLAENNENMKIIIISSYVSAGTGLNITMGKKDFDALYLTRSPYYSLLKGKDKSFYNINSISVILKSLAESANKNIKFFKDGFYNKYILNLIKKEHEMEELKAIQQALGRVERRDCNIDTKIYFVENLNDDRKLMHKVILKFVGLLNLYENKERTIIENMSILNRSILNIASFFQSNNYLENKEDIENFSKSGFNHYKSFFENKDGVYRKSMKEYRKGNKDYFWFRELNEIIRNYIFDDDSFNQNIRDFLVKHESIIKKLELYSAIRLLAKYSKQKVNREKLVTVDFEKNIYTDLFNSTNIATNPFENMYARLTIDKDEIIASDINNYNNKNKKANKDKENRNLINIYLCNIIKGNISEYFFKKYLDKNGINYNTLSYDFGEELESKLYEVFDFFIINKIEKKIYLIDVKSWKIFGDEKLKTLKDKHKNKEHKIKEIKEFSDYEINTYYINLDYNNVDGIDLSITNFLPENVSFINFFIKSYNDEKSMIINPKLKKLF